ncbi:MAG: shikimate kinase [Tannerella sp.]|nr:shikimate kinase [Tannerella sp.]
MTRIFLIGYMGAGKSTIGKALARRMNLTYIDTDCFIENRYHKLIRDIFASEGEEKFRAIEHGVLREISEYEDVIVSTGGGLPCFNDNMSLMNERGITVYLNVSIEELVSRLEASKTVRPVLQNRRGKELTDFVRESLELRKVFYEQASIRFDVENMLTYMDVNMLTTKLIEYITK